MQEQLQVTVHNPNEVNPKDFKFKTAKQLDTRQRRAERILSFEDPDNPDEPINIHLRALTPNEEAILHKVNLTKEDIAPLATAIMRKARTGESLEADDVIDAIGKKLVDSTTDEQNDERFYRRIQMGIVKPTGVTIEWLKRRNPNMLEILHNALDELAIENDLWVLRSANQAQVDTELAKLNINGG